MIDALGIERPLITGFSEGAITATIVGIRSPGAVRAIVNNTGDDAFNPDAPSPQCADRCWEAARGDRARPRRRRALLRVVRRDASRV